MHFTPRTFWYPKDVRAADQYQDSCTVAPERGAAAIADGVSTSLFSATWAKLLTESTVVDPPNTRDGAALGLWLQRQRAAWLAPIDVQSLAWHQKPKFQQGASATLLWVRVIPLQEPGGGPARVYRLYAYAIGDCCLFHVSGGQVQRAFPLEDSRLFDESPQVLRSVESAQGNLTSFVTLEDSCEAGDLLVLCTDALAQWALLELEAGRSPDFESFWTLSDNAWRETIERLRAEQRIRYDDTTLALLRIGG